MSEGALPVLGITMGDAAGVGPEVAAMALAREEVRRLARSVVIGDAGVMAEAVTIVGADLPVRAIRALDEGDLGPEALWVLDLGNRPVEDLVRGRVDPTNGRAAFEYIERAVALALADEIDAIVTAPLNKESLNRAGYPYPGHTEALAHLCGVPEDDVTMLLASPRLRVSHVSTHCSMLQAIAAVTRDRVTRVGRLTVRAVAPLVTRPPRLALAGLNPHAGEHGLFGDEDEREIAPAAAALQAEGIDAHGPVPPDSVFLRAVNGEFDAVVAMYHDQGHVPSKLTGFHDTVNITLGLPIIRTSVDHGTAFDIAGTGKARPDNMVVAIELAAGMGRDRRAAQRRSPA
jgi:4-phospho-D-threonate 3-dehydrogenase / 4-phospho-D-erythronate 3-dehydrogenase